MRAGVAAIRQHARNEGNWVLRRGGGWWYALKAVVCLVLGREQRGSFGRYDDEYIAVAAWDGRSHYTPGEPTTWSWTEFRVGRGVVRNWRYSIDEEWSG